MQNLNCIVQNELETQLKQTQTECRILKQENMKLNQLYYENKEKEKQTLSIQENLSELEKNYKQTIIENNNLKNELSFYQGCIQVKEISNQSRPSYEQIEQELLDLQTFFTKYFALQENLINQIPIQLLKECWIAINKNFKDNFNLHQNIQSIQDELSQSEQLYKFQLHNDNSLNKQQYIYEKRIEIERMRKEIQQKQIEIKKIEQEINELRNEFNYLCKQENRRYNQQLETEKQLITLRQKTQEENKTQQQLLLQNIPLQKQQQLRNRQHSDYFRGHQPSIDSIQYINPLKIPIIDNDKSNLEKTIDQTRKKLSRQLSQASNIRESRR